MNGSLDVGVRELSDSKCIVGPEQIQALFSLRSHVLFIFIQLVFFLILEHPVSSRWNGWTVAWDSACGGKPVLVSMQETPCLSIVFILSPDMPWVYMCVSMKAKATYALAPLMLIKNNADACYMFMPTHTELRWNYT